MRDNPMLKSVLSVCWFKDKYLKNYEKKSFKVV